VSIAGCMFGNIIPALRAHGGGKERRLHREPSHRRVCAKRGSPSSIWSRFVTTGVHASKTLLTGTPRF
jgi:hypothetical protein